MGGQGWVGWVGQWGHDNGPTPTFFPTSHMLTHKATHASLKHSQTHLLAAEHDPQHVGLHYGCQVVVIALKQGAVLVGVGARIVDPLGGGRGVALAPQTPVCVWVCVCV